MVAALPVAADALMKAVSEILRKRGDGMLDLFAGFYGTDSPWGRGDSYSGHGVEITLSLY